LPLNQIKEDEMSGACRTHENDEKEPMPNYKILFGILLRHRRILGYTIRFALKEIGCEVVG
jgi:hypothetical protein